MRRSRKPTPQTIAVVLALADHPSGWSHGYHLQGLVGASGSFAPESQIPSDTTAGPTKPMGDRDAHVADHVAEAPR